MKLNPLKLLHAFGWQKICPQTLATSVPSSMGPHIKSASRMADSKLALLLSSPGIVWTGFVKMASSLKFAWPAPAYVVESVGPAADVRVGSGSGSDE